MGILILLTKFKMNTIFNLQEDYIIKDERALLRPFKQQDFQNLLSLSLNESDTWKNSLLSATGHVILLFIYH